MDGKWRTDSQAPLETVDENNVNNVLKSEDIKEESKGIAGLMGGAAGAAGAGGVAAALLSNVLPESTTAKLAGEVPKESDQAASSTQEDPTTKAVDDDGSTVKGDPSDQTIDKTRSTSQGDSTSKVVDEDGSAPPGAFPDTPAQEATAFTTNPNQPSRDIGSDSNEAPTGSGAPADNGASTGNGATTDKSADRQDPINDSTINPLVTAPEEEMNRSGSVAKSGEKQYGINPIAASPGVGNPIPAAAGESIEQHKNTSSEAINANATTSKEDYEKAGSTAMPTGARVGQNEDSNNAAFDVPDRTKDMIPESSLPMSGSGSVPGKAGNTDTGPFIQSAGADTSTAALAGQVPREQQPGQTDRASNQGPFIQSAGTGTTSAALAGQVPLARDRNAAPGEDERPSATVTGPAPDVPEVIQESMATNNQNSVLGVGAAVPASSPSDQIRDASGGPAGGPTSTGGALPTPSSEPTKKLAADLDNAFDNKGVDSSPSTNPNAVPSNASGAQTDHPSTNNNTSSSPMVTTGPSQSKVNPVDGSADRQTAVASTDTDHHKPPTAAAMTGTSTNPHSSAGGEGGGDKRSKRKSILGRLKDKLKG